MHRQVIRLDTARLLGFRLERSAPIGSKIGEPKPPPTVRAPTARK